MSHWLTINARTGAAMTVFAASKEVAIAEAIASFGDTDDARTDWRATELTEDQTDELGLTGAADDEEDEDDDHGGAKPDEEDLDEDEEDDDGAW
jgi:DNA-directed RNA polymerase delta subunit